jgi:hypothetical protein
MKLGAGNSPRLPGVSFRFEILILWPRFFIMCAGRVRPLGGATPLNVHQAKVLAERRLRHRDFEWGGNRRQVAGPTGRNRIGDNHAWKCDSTMLQNATIMIPDISGYTDFLTKTELEHSSHIINELLDLLVDCNNIELTLLEVEGDALLFYRKGDPIELKPLIQQCINMFEKFHEHIGIIESDTICQCGACQTASNLSLKFIIHYGAIKELMVSGFKKASGVDMIIAHRLLKNRIGSNEYILITQHYLSNLSDKQHASDLTWQLGNEEYPAIGNIAYEYALLDRVKSRIPPIPERVNQDVKLGNNMLEVEIAASLRNVYREIIDIDRRSSWFLGSQVMERERSLKELASSTCVCSRK